MYQQLGAPTLSTHKIPQLYPYGGGPPLKVIGSCNMTVGIQDNSVISFILYKERVDHC